MATAALTFSAFPGTSSPELSQRSASLDPVSRTQTARIVLGNPEHRLAAGMIGEARISTSDAVETVLIPSEAVIATGTRQVVIVEESEGIYRAQEVRVGAEAAGHSAILAGIDDGERVVLSGQFLIDSEASLTGTLARLGSDAAPTPREGPSLRHCTRPRHLLAISDGNKSTPPVPCRRWTWAPCARCHRRRRKDQDRRCSLAFFRND
jgi:Cu(I)/Ag(I) efflux system membrane fusion protein